jgi:3-carboxy-cis,cis-muconate cycloisomerase
LPADRLFGPALTTPAMSAAVGDEAWLSALLRFEAALASAQARLGIIPLETANAIATKGRARDFDLAAIGAAATASASPVVPLVDALKGSLDPEHARHVHEGATSQDAVDTAMMLVSRDGLDLLLADLDSVASHTASLAQRYRDAPIAGRTLLQQARPITFGAKSAGWLHGILAARRRLRGLRRRLPVQLAGPVGTLSGLGRQGKELVEALAEELDLIAPAASWQTDRGLVAELGTALAIAAGTAAKVALDIVLLSQTEVGEVTESAPGRSSAMPEKRNPAHAVEARAAYSGAVAQAGLLLGALAGEHERAAGAWQSEWPALSETFRLSAGAVARTKEAVDGLVVDPERMRANLVREPGDVELAAASAAVDRVLAIYHDEEEDKS